MLGKISNHLFQSNIKDFLKNQEKILPPRSKKEIRKEDRSTGFVGISVVQLT